MIKEDKQIESPCVRNCCLDDDDVCLGCFRTMTEIIKWSEASMLEREAIILKAKQRATNVTK
jgi:predicted Fe-S protein YdhL (DUF1289 family)